METVGCRLHDHSAGARRFLSAKASTQQIRHHSTLIVRNVALAGSVAIKTLFDRRMDALVIVIAGGRAGGMQKFVANQRTCTPTSLRGPTLRGPKPFEAQLLILAVLAPPCPRHSLARQRTETSEV